MSTNNLSIGANTFGLPGNDFGLVDKQSQGVGMSEVNLKDNTPQVTLRDNLIYIDTRDCIGQLSLREAQLAFSYDVASRGKIEPSEFKTTLNNNSIVVPSKLVNLVSRLDREGVIKGFPRLNPGDPWIEGNTMRVKLPQIIKLVKNIDIVNMIIPRDIIPMYVYFPNFINSCLPLTLTESGSGYLNPSVGNPSSTWESPVPETIEDFFDKEITGIASNKLGGVYETPLRYWRSYTSVNSMPDPYTPPPYQMWNPPQDYNANGSPWPFQRKPIQGQRIPSYEARNGVVFAGYGLYDLDDFPESQEVQVANGNTIQIPIRKLILKLIVPRGQYINGISAESMIDNSISDDFNEVGVVDNPLMQTGYGDYQRFIPGPGVGMRYQPNQVRNLKSAPIDLSCSTYDSDTGYLGPMPVPFPNFRGNVWGPYGRPGDRFQNASLQLTVDELYLNGDLENLEGNPMIWPAFNPTIESYTLEYFVANLKRINTTVRFNNFISASNPNIKNAMRVQFEGGFGAVSVSVGDNTTTRGVPGPIEINGLPNTQYDGAIHRVNPEVWIEPRKDNPANWLDTLSGPQKPTIVSTADNSFLGWMYTWRDIFPWTGDIYVPITAGGTGPMEYFECSTDEWKKTEVRDPFTTGSSQWSCSPVIGQSNNYCIPLASTSTFEYIGNLPWGQVQTISLTDGGTEYEVQRYRLALYDELLSGDEGDVDVTSVNADGRILTFTNVSYVFTSTVVMAAVDSNKNNAAFLGLIGNVLQLHTGGSNYTVEDDVSTKTQTGSGTGLTVNITSVYDLATNVPGVIDGIVISNPGSGYVTGDIVLVFQEGSDNNALLLITDAAIITTEIIPQYNTYHYHDPLAVGASAPSSLPSITQNILNGTDCTEDCPGNECSPLNGEYEVCVGESIADAAMACSDPRPIPDPPCLLKCDYIALESPESEWETEINSGTAACRPNDSNLREKQRSSYVDRRLSYTDFGANNGTFITALTNYRALFISSTPDTDVVIHIEQAPRTTYTQSLNPQVSHSNFFIPIRLSLGSTTGTLEYIEAVQGQLTSAGIYWVNQYHPPLAKLSEFVLTFFTYNSVPIPLERTFGFKRQFNEQATLFSNSIISSFIVHGSYADFAPNLPPFSTSTTSTPSSTLLTGASNSQSQTDPYNPTLLQYTQRNLSIAFRVQNYQGENPGITHIIKRMPGVDRDQQVSEQFNDLIPVASNVDEYDEYDTDNDDDYY